MVHIYEYKNFSKSHKLSGVALLVEDKICLVLPKKFKGKKKYSIPKGHIENGLPYNSALSELIEETGLDISDKRYDRIIDYTYNKKGVEKYLKVYVYDLSKDEFNSIPKYNHNKKEIFKVKLVNRKRAKKLVENHFSDLIDFLF